MYNVRWKGCEGHKWNLKVRRLSKSRHILETDSQKKFWIFMPYRGRLIDEKGVIPICFILCNNLISAEVVSDVFTKNGLHQIIQYSKFNNNNNASSFSKLINSNTLKIIIIAYSNLDLFRLHYPKAKGDMIIQWDEIHDEFRVWNVGINNEESLLELMNDDALCFAFNEKQIAYESLEVIQNTMFYFCNKENIFKILEYWIRSFNISNFGDDLLNIIKTHIDDLIDIKTRKEMLDMNEQIHSLITFW